MEGSDTGVEPTGDQGRTGSPTLGVGTKVLEGGLRSESWSRLTTQEEWGCTVRIPRLYRGGERHRECRADRHSPKGPDGLSGR